MTLRARFTAFIAAVALLTVGACAAALLFSEASHLRRQSEAAHWRSAEHLAAVCGEAMMRQNELMAVNFFDELRSAPDFLAAQCLDSEGRLWLDSALSVPEGLGAPAPLARGKSVQSAEGKTEWSYTARQERGGRLLAGGRVIYDGGRSHRMVRDLLWQTVRRSFAAPVAVFVMGLLLSWAAARALTRPILNLAAGARQVGKGQWSARVKTGAPGELGELAGEFNAMAQKLGELDELKDQFIRTVSHDLRNPLGAVATSAELLKREPLSERAAPLVDIIESSVVRLDAMVNNILDTARMKEGKLTYQISTVSVGKLAAELVRLFAPVAGQAGKTLVLELPADLPSIEADEEKVFRILLNLLNNALKFSREGDRVAVKAASAAGGIELRVSDTGLGIAPERLARIFEPFRSTENSTSEARKKQGAGLGLSIVKVLVEGHGGSVAVESQLDRGTTFTVFLPSASK